MEKAKQPVALGPFYVRWPKAVKAGTLHYYHGFRLLFLEMWLSAKYLWRFLRRKPLMRREKQQLIRTLSDVLRLIPFSAFIIIPFMEFTLPFFLKLFPNMLPSTFKDASKEVIVSWYFYKPKFQISCLDFVRSFLNEIVVQQISNCFFSFLKKITSWLRDFRHLSVYISLSI